MGQCEIVAYINVLFRSCKTNDKEKLTENNVLRYISGFCNKSSGISLLRSTKNGTRKSFGLNQATRIGLLLSPGAVFGSLLTNRDAVIILHEKI